MVSSRIEEGPPGPANKPVFREVISLDSDSDSTSGVPPHKTAVPTGTYASAPKHASQYNPNPSSYNGVPGNGYIAVHHNHHARNGGAPLRDGHSEMEQITDINEVFENQSVTTAGERDDEDKDEDDEDKELFDESFPEMGDDSLLNSDDPEVCTLEEARQYRKMLRALGPRKFVAQTVEADVITAKKLITAFGCASPAWMADADDVNYYPFLQWALIRELHKRVKLQKYNTVSDAVKLLQTSENIIVLTGAGISTSLGIPDFRSKDIGLYAKLEHLGLSDPQEVFDIELFREDPTVFYSVAKDIIPDHKRFTPTHAFIKLLQDKGKLLTNYSQNIDNIEGVAGVSPEKLIQCHGSFATASCTKCHAKVPGEAIFPDIREGVIPRCQKCLQFLKSSADPSAMKRKRSKNRSDSKKKSRKSKDFEDSSEEEEGAYDLPAAGVMKPDITFFGEALPDTFHQRLVKHDKGLVDLVVVIGTSLKVAPVSEVVDYLEGVPTIYISREPVKHIYFDIDLLGDCDIVVAELCRRAGWGLEHEMIPDGQKIEIKGDPNFPSRWTFKQTHPMPVKKEEDDLSVMEEKTLIEPTKSEAPEEKEDKREVVMKKREESDSE